MKIKKEKLYKVICPVCKTPRFVSKAMQREIERGKQSGRCVQCGYDSMRNNNYEKDGKYEIICPVCGNPRSVSKQTKRRFDRGVTSGRCASCGVRAAKERKRIAIEGYLEEEISAPPNKKMNCCGCELTSMAEQVVDNFPFFQKCEWFYRCKNSSECLNAVAIGKWLGWVADGKGFKEKEPEDILDIVRMNEGC